MKIGDYTDDEILEFMTEGEGRGFLGRSMFDAMYFEIERLNNIIKHTDSWIDRTIAEETIKIIKQQPSEDDTWILERLYGIKQCLQGSEKE